MKLQILPAKQGLTWVRLGIRTFWRQPLAMTGQFFLFMGLLSLCSLIPLIGSFIGLALLPMASLGLMAATREAHLGHFPCRICCGWVCDLGPKHAATWRCWAACMPSAFVLFWLWRL